MAAPKDTYPLLLTPTEASELLRLKPKTVMGLCAAGKLPAFKLGGVWRIRRNDLWEMIGGEE